MATLQALEIAITGISEQEWEQEAKDRARARANRRLAHILEDELEDVARAALYHAGKLVIGCCEKPKPIYGHSGVDTEIWGNKVSTSNAQANRAFSIGDW